MVYQIFDDKGQFAGDQGTPRDISAKKGSREAERTLRQSEECSCALTALSSDWFKELDEKFRFIQIAGKRTELEGR